MWGLIQISGDGRPEVFLLQSKVAWHGSHDRHISDVETPRRAARRHPAVFGSRDGASAVFRVDRTACGPDGARLRRGRGAQVVLRLAHSGDVTKVRAEGTDRS